ncbi:hypothetical protein 6939_0019 [Klebsiella phage 6939]|uniref:Uncharacterized protein n=1 Tax=Klebsiella phage 6939 TaxID=2912295 RepID=A0A9E7M8A6_9CAUD|nr:hypothetical protein 6939_0019 [Klebsiella phage 6939]
MSLLTKRFDEVDAKITKLQEARKRTEPFSAEWWNITSLIGKELDKLTVINRACCEQNLIHYTTGLPADLRIGL